MTITPQVGEGSAAWAGVLELDIAQSGDRSVAKKQYHEGALRVIRPHYLDGNGHLTYTVVNPGGAYFGADHYLLDFHVRQGGSLTVTTQSATKVYKTPQGPAVQHMKVTLEPDAYLEYVPDQLIVYRDGDYRQTTDVLMHASSTLCMSEIVTPGWSPDATDFTYKGLSMRTEIKVTDGQSTSRLALDFLRVRPSEEGNIAAPGLMEGFTHTGQLLIASAQLTDELCEQVRALAEASDTRSGVSLLGHARSLGVRGIAVRSLGHRTEDIALLHNRIIDIVRASIAGMRPLELRKY